MIDSTLIEENTDDQPTEAIAAVVVPPPVIEYVESADAGELRSLIFQTSDTIEKLLDVPEWKVNGKVVQVLVRALNTLERTQYVTMLQNTNNDLTKAYPDLVIMTARHPVTKQLIFKPADRGELQKKLGLAVERIALTASRISGLDQATLDTFLKN